MNFKEIFEKLYPSYMNKLWKYTFQNFASYYVQFIIFQSSKYSPKEDQKMVAKVKDEIDIMDGFFKAVLPSKDAENLGGILNDLYGAFINSPEDTIVNIVNLKIFLKKDFSDKSMVVGLHQALIMRMRADIPDELKSKIKELIDKENKKLALIEKRQMFKLMTKNLLTEYTIRRFTEKFRLRYQEKQEQRAKYQNDRHNEDILKINENERLEIEQDALSLTVMMDYFKVAVQNEKNLTVHLNAIKSAKTKKAKFSFIDDILLVHDDQQNLLEKIFLVSIKEVLCHEQLHIYMVLSAHQTYASNSMLIMKSRSPEERKKWINSILFLRAESLSELKPIEFQKFSCVDKSHSFDEIFLCDQPDYTYNKLQILNQKLKKKAKKFDIDEIELKQEGSHS